MNRRKNLFIVIVTLLSLFLAHYVAKVRKPNIDISKVEETRAENNVVAKEQDSIRREYFLALAPTYVAGSYYLMQLSSKNTTFHFLWLSYTLPYTTYINIGLSVFFLMWALFLCYLAFFWIPKSNKDTVYQWVASLSGIAIIFFTYEWIKNLTEIIKSGMNIWYFYLSLTVGLFVLVALGGYPYIILFKRINKKLKRR